MLTVAGFIAILKCHHLWVADQAITEDSILASKPVTDSRLINEDDIFVCIRGFESDGHTFINQARAKQASLIIQEDEFKDSYACIRVSNSRKAAALLAKHYYDNPTSKFTLIGITGTNGKTTTSLLLWQALTKLGKKTGWIGTLGYKIDDEIIPTNNTTPDILELNGIFDQMVQAGCQYVVMEVSSHALALDRVYGLAFDLAMFTNLSRDHLDFHKNMQDYFESKYLLFEYVMQNNGLSLINIDDGQGRVIVERIQAAGKFRLKTISEQQGDYTISQSFCDTEGCSFSLTKQGSYAVELHSKLSGHFNMLNTAMTIAAVSELFPDIKTEELQKIASALKPVRGRLEQVRNHKNLGIYVDYAHTPDALKNVLETLQKLPHKRIITVFGAGGDRDKGKRPQMLKSVMQYSDAVIITDDNPRTENPNEIIRDIIGDNEIWQPWWIIRNRKTAINAALRIAQAGDIVLLAGKGHESYQEINGVRHPFDDVQTASELLKNTEKVTQGELALPIDLVLLELLYKSSFDGLENQEQSFRFVSTDSRSIKSGSLFFALKGENFDGMNYVDSVLTDQSNAAIVSADSSYKTRTVSVSDTQKALGILAKKYLQMFSVHKIALTGSTGKTTTKEFLANIFAEQGKTLKTLANENNIIGLCKTIFRLSPEDQTAIFELGTNHFGEIKTLTEICFPDMAMITNIGPSHLEFLGDEAGVYKEKTELFRTGAKTIIYPGDDKRFDEFKDIGKSVGFSSECVYHVHELIQKADYLTFMLNDYEWNVKQQVPYFVINIAFAIAAALESGLSAEQIQQGLGKQVALANRMETFRLGSYTIINDCYNANPVSMKSAIEFWHSCEPEKPHIAILGDMLELGTQAEKYHQEIGKLLAGMNYKALITIGTLSKLYHSKSDSPSAHRPEYTKHYSTIDVRQIQPILASTGGEAVLIIKASHGLHLEKVVDEVIHEISNQLQRNQIRE
ncbi:MAG: UDP-N-acetylmuramoyl-L-alanyl-D-glutamate--2,6-diaminopimelate ligase [Candidatus Cloacimonadaceae bacterium]